LLHLVDIGPQGKPVADVAAIVSELERFSPELAARERWLVLNKTDLLPEAEREQRCREVLAALQWQGPVFEISALAADGTDRLVQAVMDFIESSRAVEDAADAG
jgi:GTP-binding protein